MSRSLCESILHSMLTDHCMICGVSDVDHLLMVSDNMVVFWEIAAQFPPWSVWTTVWCDRLSRKKHIVSCETWTQYDLSDTPPHDTQVKIRCFMRELYTIRSFRHTPHDTFWGDKTSQKMLISDTSEILSPHTI